MVPEFRPSLPSSFSRNGKLFSPPRVQAKTRNETFFFRYVVPKRWSTLFSPFFFPCLFFLRAEAKIYLPLLCHSSEGKLVVLPFLYFSPLLSFLKPFAQVFSSGKAIVSRRSFSFLTPLSRPAFPMSLFFFPFRAGHQRNSFK